MKALLRPAFVFGLSIAIAVTSLVGSSSVALAAGPVITSIELEGGPVVYEGARPFLKGTFTGGAGQGPFTVEVDWMGDGAFEDWFSFDEGHGAFRVQKTDPYANEKAGITIWVRVEDLNGVHRKSYPDADKPRVTVLNAAPSFDSLTLSATQIDEGGAVTATAMFSDPGSADTHTLTLDWKDGTLPIEVSLDAGVVTFTTDRHTFEASGEYTVSATVTDNGGGSAVKTALLSVRVPNKAPTMSVDVTVGNEGGGTSSLAVTFADADADDTHIVSIAWGDGQTTDSGTLAPAQTTFDATHIYADGDTYSLVVTLTDSATPAHSVSETYSVSPTNVAPVLGALTLLPTSLVDHQMLTLSGSFTDPGTADSFTLTVDWGDGSSSTQALDTAGEFSDTHAYDAAGPVTITVTVEDSDDATTSATADLLVEPSSPAGLALEATVSGSNATIDGAFTTWDADDTHTVTVNWGDGESTSQFLAPGRTTFEASHVYEASRTYTVEVIVNDTAGASTSAHMEVVVTVSAGSASDVIDEMITLVRNFELDRNTERWLVKKLTDMNSSLAYGNSQVCSSTGTLAHILAFAERNLTDDQNGDLRAFATRLEAAAGCTSSASQTPRVLKAPTATTTTASAQSLTTTVTPAPTQKKDTTTNAKSAKSDFRPAGGRSSH
jgi:PKD repeat protein